MDDLDKKTTPGISLIKLLGLMILVGLSLQLVFGGLISLISSMINPENKMQSSLLAQNPFVLKFLLAVSSISIFILPAVILYRLESKVYNYFERARAIKPIYFVYTFLAMLCFMPMMSLISNWNESMQFPNSLQFLQDWMRESEDSAALMTKKIVEDATWIGFFINLIVLALLPAIGEELFFRGCLQNIFGRWMRNKHAVIWLVAIIFSAFHLQFFGFVPRLLLGAFFGYLYLWSRNIYLPIFGHFVNNAGAAVTAFYYSRKGVSFEQMSQFEQESIWVYLASLIFTVIFVVLFYNSSKKSIYGARLEEN